MVSKNNNFQQNRAMQQQQQRQNVRAAMAPYRKPFRLQTQNQIQPQNQMMYSSCQMPSDPLYIDFNTPAPTPQTTQTVNNGSAAAAGAGGPTESRPAQTDGGKKKQLKGKQQKGNKQQQQQQHPQLQHNHNTPFPPQKHGGSGNHLGGDNSWQPHRFNVPNGNRFNGPHRNGFNRIQMNGPANLGIARHMMGPMCPGPMGMRGCGPIQGGPMPPYQQMPFQPPMRCPMPPMGGPLPPPPPFMRRNGRGVVNRPPMPPPLMGPHMMGPRMPPRGMPRGIGPFNVVHMNGNMNGGKIKKPNANLVKHAVKGKSTIKTLKTLVNQYPIDKPWVNDHIRSVHDEKLNIENRLKGNKDDDLFAQFKVQRDKFVSLYESAREAYLKQEAAEVMAKDVKDKNSNTKQIAAAKAGKTKDATVSIQNQSELNTNEPQATQAIKRESKIINISKKQSKPSQQQTNQQQPERV